ncbi:MAG: EAL domain-containing protein [Pseudomonadota bacterium]
MRRKDDFDTVHSAQSLPLETKAKEQSEAIGKSERDVIALGIAIAAIFLLIATGGAVLPDVVASAVYNGQKPDALLANALLLNIALIIFGWRRHRELKTEIATRREAENLARELAETDPLTGCLNRRSMERETNSLRLRAYERGMAVAYVMIDIDNFKQINDVRGHSAGDEVLKTLADRIGAQLPKGSKLARLGGDEFAFITAYDPVMSERVDDLVIRLYETLGHGFVIEGVTYDVTMSVGIATDYDEEGRDPLPVTGHTLMQRADIAMYHAKKQGKNRFFWFEPSMESELRFRNELESGIRQGLTRGEFVPYYEQQVDLETGELVGFEMLARWRSPQLGLVSPEIFIPIAEEMGVIAELSEQLMQHAFVDAAEWDEALTLSVNISPVQLRDPWFAQKLLKLLVKMNFPPRRLDIEITESCLHDNIGMVRSMITSLRNQGVRVSLDDFGTGYSSLEQLRTLPFDRLKIDRSFVSELSRSEEGSRIVDAIVSLGRGLDMPITAEGVEDEAILAALKQLGQLKGQGYLYGRPETADQVRDRLNAQGLLTQRQSQQDRRGRETGKADRKGQRRDPEEILRQVRG